MECSVSVVFEITYLQHKRLLMEKRKERTDNLEETPHSHLPYSDFGDSIINDKQQMKKKKVFVSGCYDLLHSGHVEFFQQASRYRDLYVGIGSDATYLALVVKDSLKFAENHDEAIHLQIRRA